MQAASGKIFLSSDSTETTCLLRHMKQSTCDNTEAICLRGQKAGNADYMTVRTRLRTTCQSGLHCGLPDSQDTVAIILDLVLLFGCDIDCKVIRTLGIYLHKVRTAGDIKLMPVVGHCAPAFGGDDKIAEI